MLVKIKEKLKLKTSVQMLSIGPGTTKSEQFPIKDDGGDWKRYAEYSIVSENVCCKDMETAVIYDMITFSADCGKYCFEIPMYDSEGDYIGHDDMVLKYCPFCGATPKYEVVEQTKEYPVLEDYKYKVFKTIVEPQYEAVEVSRKKLTNIIERVIE